MRLSLIIIGVFIILVGAVGYYITYAKWKLWIIPIPNPFAVFQPFVWVLLALGVVSFFLGILLKGSDE